MTGPDTKDNDTGNSNNVQNDVANDDAENKGLDLSSKAAEKGKTDKVNAQASCAGMI